MSAGELALQLQEQGWRGLLPVLPPDAQPHIRLDQEQRERVETSRGKAPGRCTPQLGWSLLLGWGNYPDDAITIEGWADWPGVNVGLRACHAAPWVTFLDVDVLDPEAAGACMALLRNRLGPDFIFRIGQAPKFLIPVRTTEPVRRARSVVVEIAGSAKGQMVELLGQGQQAVLHGIHPVTSRPYFWPAGGPEDTEPGKLPLLTPSELNEILGESSTILLRYGAPFGRKGRPVRGEFHAGPRPLTELRAGDPALIRVAAEFVVNNDWSYDDWVSWAYALRGAFGPEGKELWLQFSAQSVKAVLAVTEQVWRDVSRAERDGLLRSGAATVLAVARQEGFEPPPARRLPPYFGGDRHPPGLAHAELEEAVRRWVKDALDYDGKGDPPREAIAATAGLGKTDVTLRALADLAKDKTVHFYAPTLKLGAEVVANAQAIGLDAVLLRGREENQGDPDRWPALCQKVDVAAILARTGRNVWSSLCRKMDESGNDTRCEFFDGCPYVAQFKGLEGKLIVLAHEWLSLPKSLLPNSVAVIIDERFHTSLTRTADLPFSRITAQRLSTPGIADAKVADLTHDAKVAMNALEAGQTMAGAGLTPDRLRQMAQLEIALADPPAIWPSLSYVEQQRRAARLREIEAFKLAKLWRTLAQDHERHTQRIVVARGIAHKGELQDRVFVYSIPKLRIGEHDPVLLLDADHDPLIGNALLPVRRRTAILPELNAEVTQITDTACSKRKLLGDADNPASLAAAAGRRRREIIDLARHRAAQGRRVLIGTYKPVAELLRQQLADQPCQMIEIASFGAIRGLDEWKDFDTVIVAGREQPPSAQIENMARGLFGADPEPLLLTGCYVQQSRGHLMKDGSRTAITVWVHPDLRVQAVLEQVREREIEQMACRLRVVHRDRPAEVLLLTNLPTALPVDRLVTWNEIVPSKLQQAIVAGQGVLPLSYAELARAHPSIWPKERAVRWGQSERAGKGASVPYIESYWYTCTLSRATRITYRRPGQARGSPHQAIIPGDVRDPAAAAAALAPLLGEVLDVTLVKTLQRPTAGVIEDHGEPPPLVIPLPQEAGLRIFPHYFSFKVGTLPPVWLSPVPCTLPVTSRSAARRGLYGDRREPGAGP